MGYELQSLYDKIEFLREKHGGEGEKGPDASSAESSFLSNLSAPNTNAYQKA